jgi:hypothetical protein
MTQEGLGLSMCCKPIKLMVANILNFKAVILTLVEFLRGRSTWVE